MVKAKTNGKKLSNEVVWSLDLKGKTLKKLQTLWGGTFQNNICIECAVWIPASISTKESLDLITLWWKWTVWVNLKKGQEWLHFWKAVQIDTKHKYRWHVGHTQRKWGLHLLPCHLLICWQFIFQAPLYLFTLTISTSLWNFLLTLSHCKHHWVSLLQRANGRTRWTKKKNLQQYYQIL